MKPEVRGFHRRATESFLDARTVLDRASLLRSLEHGILSRHFVCWYRAWLHDYEWSMNNNTLCPQLMKSFFANTFSLVVWTSRHWNFSWKFVWHLCRNLCMGIAERRPCAILQLRTLCRLTENVVNCERSEVHWKAYTISSVCTRRECSLEFKLSF